MSDANFYLSKKQRDELPKNSFGHPEKRLFPILTQDDVTSASKLLGRAKLTDAEKLSVKKRIIKIATREGFEIPESWKSNDSSGNNSELSAQAKVTWINDLNLVGFGMVKNINGDTVTVELCENSESGLNPTGILFNCSKSELDLCN